MSQQTSGTRFSRRSFLGLSAVAAAASACRPAAGTGDESLPPAIAALSSMTDRARPISSAERRARLDRASRLMAESGVDALLLTGGTSMVYFTGIEWGRSERLFAVVLPAEGRPLLVTPAFEEDRAREQISGGPLADDAEVRVWQEDEDPYRLVADGLRQRGFATGTLGIEETVRFVTSSGLSGAAPALGMVSATAVTAGCRGRKDAHELELMRLACEVTLQAFDAVYRSIRVGMTGEEIGGLIRTAHGRLGFTGGALVLVDEATALPHGTLKPQVVREGSIVLIDGGCKVEGYASDISRTFAVGHPTDRMKHVFEVELRAQTAALAAARPGAEAQAVDAAARQVIEKAGFGPGYRHFTHRVGHGIGMDGHEWPYLVPGNRLLLEPGMTFSDEPGIYFPGEFGVRLEDDMVITDDGAELFTPQSPSLEDPFGVV